MKVLKLHSPLGVKPISYTWPLTSNCENVKSKKNTVPAIVQTMQWVCYDYPEIQCALQNNILADYDINSYESMKNICNRFNKMIETLTNLEKGTSLSQKRIKTQASRDLLRHIMQQVYIRAVDDPRKLNDYEPFSSEVYGETSYDYVCQIIDYVQATQQDVFIDLGSGVGQIVLQMAASTPCKLCIGIECAKNPNIFAKKMDKYFREWMAWFGKKYGNYELIQGDFLHDKFQTKIKHCSIFFTNNILFGPYINYRLKESFSSVKDGTKIVSTRNFCQRNFRTSNRHQNDIGRIMTVVQLPALPDAVSWTGKPFSFYLHVIDRTKQYEFNNQMSISTITEESKNNGSTEKKKIGRPRRVPAKEKEEYAELDINSRRTLIKQKIDKPRSVLPKEKEEYFSELKLHSRRTVVKQMINRPRSVPPKEKEEYPGLHQNLRRTLVEQMIDRPRSVPVKEKEDYQELKQNSRRTLVLKEEEEYFPGLVRQSRRILMKQKIDRSGSVPVKEKEEYKELKQNSQRTLVKQRIDSPKSVPVKEKEEFPRFGSSSQRTLVKKIGRPRSVSFKEKEDHQGLVRKSQRTLVKQKTGSPRLVPVKEKEEHHIKLVQNSRITSVKKNIDLPRPAPIKGKKEYHPQLLQHPLSRPEELESSDIDYSSCNTSRHNSKVVGMLTKTFDRPLKTIAFNENHRSILKTSLRKLENSDKDSSSCYGNTTRNLNELPKRILKTTEDKINKPLSPVYEEFEHLNYSNSENTDQELNKLQKKDLMKSLDSSDISISDLQNTDTPLLNKTWKLNDSESVVSVDSLSNNKITSFQTNIVRPNAPRPLSKNPILQTESRLAKKLALLQKQVNSPGTHSMMLRKKTVRQSTAANKRLNKYLRNKMKQHAAIISKNNQNDLKRSHTNNSKIMKRIITKIEYRKISSRNTEIVCPEFPTRTVPTEMMRPEIPSGMVLKTKLTEKIRPETYKEMTCPKILKRSATEILRPKTPTRMVPTEMLRPEIPSGMLFTEKLTKKICPETHSEKSSGSTTEIVHPETPTRMVPTEMLRPKIPSRMLLTEKLTKQICPETHSEKSTGSTTEIFHPESPTRTVPTEMVRPEMPSGRGHTKTIFPEIDSKMTRPKLSPGISNKLTCPNISATKIPTEMARVELPSGIVYTEKRPDLSTKKISKGTTNLAVELSKYCKQFQEMVECNTINNDKIVAFQNAINLAIAKDLKQDIEKNKTMQLNCQTKDNTVKINYAKRMKERDMRNYLKRKLFRNQIKKVTLKKELQRKLLSKIKNTSQDRIPQRKIYEDNDDNISVSSVASPEYTPFVKEDVEFFFKHFFQHNRC